MTIIGVRKMKNGQLENYFVHRMVSGRIWRDIKDKNTVTVLSDKVQRLLITSYIFFYDRDFDYAHMDCMYKFWKWVSLAQHCFLYFSRHSYRISDTGEQGI